MFHTTLNISQNYVMQVKCTITCTWHTMWSITVKSQDSNLIKSRGKKDFLNTVHEQHSFFLSAASDHNLKAQVNPVPLPNQIHY